MPEPALIFRDLTLGYNQHPAVHHLSGSIATGSLTAVVGANGSAALLTQALLAGSPALDKGVAGGPTTDERGFSRPDGVTGKMDVGAFELQNDTLAVMVTPGTPVVVGGTATFTVTVTNAGTNSLPADNSTVTVTLPPGLVPPPNTPLTFTVV